ncbi:MAG: hypothetical protein EA351_13365 [Gemmatimonadales bacterium]|nr:MAG: hypothetical protein EA351_13365 [Gemmatimonadales bacterium]
MAKKKGSSPSRRPSEPQGTADDAFSARVLEFVAWARQNTQMAIIGVVAIVLLIGGTIYFLTQRSQQYEQAATELEMVQQVAAMSPTPEAVAEIEGYLVRFGGTPYGIEARLLLAEILLEDGNPEAAIETLLETAPSFRNSLRLQATFLLAVAYEDAERWDDAAEVYSALKERGEFTFQRREAGEGLARVLLAQGDTTGATDAFRALLDIEPADSPLRDYFEMRLAELTRGDG